MQCVLKVIGGLESTGYFIYKMKSNKTNQISIILGASPIDGSPAIAFMEPEG